MPDVAIIPIRSFRLGKQRLSGLLEDPEREDLGRRLAAHVASTAVAADAIPLVVSADAAVADWSIHNGFSCIPDPDQGLDAAARTGADWALAARSRWAVLHSDLPALTEGDVRQVFDGLSLAPSVIAPSSDGGTSALASSREVEFAYGPASFHRHLARLEDPMVVVSTGLLLDLDSPNDFDASGGFIR